MVSVDCETVAKQASVKLLTPVHHSKQFSFNVCISCFHISEPALLAKATGLLSCKSTAPRPFSEASTCKVISFFGST